MTNSPAPNNEVILLAKLQLREGLDADFAAWRARVLSNVATTAGFLSSSVSPAVPHSPTRKLEFRFRDSGHLEQWRQSADWATLVADARGFLGDNCAVETEVVDGGEKSGVVEVVITRVKPGQEEAYHAWENRIQQAQAAFPGYLGSYVQPPIAGDLGWTTLMRFETAENLETWLKSPERAALLTEAQPLIDYAHLQRLDSSFPGWFPTDPATGKGPPNWKASMLVLLGLFPIVMLESKFLSPHLSALELSPAMFIGNVLSVAATTWLTMPLFIKLFGWWLFPKDDGSATRTNIAGAAIIAALFAIEIEVMRYI